MKQPATQPDAARIGPWPTERAPGKVIAVHLNYRSRARQRGRVPTAPSFFLKPATSVSASGVVARPEGTELLTFEGEVAVVIGRLARCVSVQEAWSVVAGVTAANDLGLQDLKDVDRGSNLRSKGGDGFTPLGRVLLPAEETNPNAIRLRTWHNDRLVQDALTDDLIFDLPRLVSEVSELVTLEPGDVILAGTPAGASVAVPGDVLEVEVDVPGGPSTGRLRTAVIKGPPLRNPRIASVTDASRADAWGLEVPGQPAALDPEVAHLLDQVSTATVSSQLRRRGLHGVTMDGLSALAPGRRLLGRARTLRFVALREDLFDDRGVGHNVQKQAFDTIAPGEVLVIEARERADAGTLGDILALRAVERGAAGVVTDGAVRDQQAVAATGLAVFAAGAHPAVLGRRHVPWDRDTTITCAGVTVQPGDIVLGDDDGVVVIPAHLVVEVATDSVEQERAEAFIAEQVRAGESVEGLYPMNSAWQQRYSAWSGPDTGPDTHAGSEGETP